MNSFRTEIFPKKSLFYVNYHKKNIFIGSCFSENIGSKLLENKFPVLINPLGVLYNPFSVQKALEIIINKTVFTENDLHFKNDKWFSFYHHSSFSNPDKEVVLKKINSKINETHYYLKEAQTLFITFGTSWYYKLIDNEQVVANCHKLPANLFERAILSVDEIVNSWQKIMQQLKAFKPDLKIVFTVSPIRHWKDGAVNNQLSKSILIVAIQKLLNNFKQVSYFPAYEIMMDDLRDYRFYADDFLHPNSLAINYIWNKFKAAFFEEKTIEILKQVQKVIKAVNHRAFHPQTNSYKQFLESNLEKIKQLNAKYPFVDLEIEKEHCLREVDKYFKTK